MSAPDGQNSPDAPDLEHLPTLAEDDAPSQMTDEQLDQRARWAAEEAIHANLPSRQSTELQRPSAMMMHRESGSMHSLEQPSMRGLSRLSRITALLPTDVFGRVSKNPVGYVREDETEELTLV